MGGLSRRAFPCWSRRWRRRRVVMVELVELVLGCLEQEQDRRAATASIGGRGGYQLAG